MERAKDTRFCKSFMRKVIHYGSVNKAIGYGRLRHVQNVSGVNPSSYPKGSVSPVLITAGAGFRRFLSRSLLDEVTIRPLFNQSAL